MENRPALVLSPENFNRRIGFAFVCPISNTQRQSPFYVSIPEADYVSGVIMADQLRSLDFKSRKAHYASRCPELVVQDVLRRIKPVLFG
ncbi:MAG: type II toxin-antitoxin system PemK/MazF family toxin [Cyanobacteria bacterium J06627_28]